MKRRNKVDESNFITVDLKKFEENFAEETDDLLYLVKSDFLRRCSGSLRLIFPEPVQSRFKKYEKENKEN